MNIKLKPVTIINARYPKYKQNTTQQMFLLNALKITQDPNKLREMIGVKRVADVFRTLDKLAMRKEYHKALVASGIDFNYIIRGIKTEAETAYKPGDRLKALQILLKSLGMDKYDDPVDGGGAQWEDDLLKKIEEEKKTPQLTEGDKKETLTEYEVKVPEMPESVKKSKKREADIGKSLYE